MNNIVALFAYMIPYFLLPLAFKMAGGLIGNLSGMAQDRTNGLRNGLGKRRQEAMKKGIAGRKDGSRFNTDESSIMNKMTGGGYSKFANFTNKKGVEYSTGTKGWFNPAVRKNAAANISQTKSDDYAREDNNFAKQMNNEGTMAAHALRNDKAKMAKLKFFQNEEDGSANVKKINDAVNASKSIEMSKRSVWAAGHALAASGKVIQNQEEAGMLFDGVSYGDKTARGAAEGQLRHVWRSQAGRQDIGRATNYEGLQEMGIQQMSSLKPIAAQNFFGKRVLRDANGVPRIGADGKVMKQSNFQQILEQQTVNGRKITPQERQHHVDLLYAAQNNASLTPEQYASVQEAIEYTTDNHPGMWQNARNNYSAKLQGGENPQVIQRTQPPVPPAGAGQGGIPGAAR